MSPIPLNRERVLQGRRGGVGNAARFPPWAVKVWPIRQHWGVGWRRKGGSFKIGSCATEAEADAIADTLRAALRAGVHPPALPKYSARTGKVLPPRELEASRTYSVAELHEEVRRGRLDPETVYPAGIERPTRRSECRNGMRPCPFVSCSKNLALDSDRKTGSLTLYTPSVPIWERQESCVSDVEERGEATLDEVGQIFGVCRERSRQIENTGLAKLRALAKRKKIDFETPVERGSNTPEDGE